jgi:hypothetical protein
MALPFEVEILTRNERRYRSRLSCMLCEQRLDRSSCGAVWPPRCTPEQMEARRQAALSSMCARSGSRPQG